MMLHAWFSAKAAEQFGYAVYARVNGEEVAVTEVRGDDVKEPTSKNWDDLEYVGVVGRFVRAPDQEEDFYNEEGPYDYDSYPMA